MSSDELQRILLANVAEVKFTRREPKVGSPATRRMLCTNNAELLRSANGKVVLHYEAARKMPNFNPKEKNLVITWDIFMQDYRCINADAAIIIRTIPANDEFWNYFNEHLLAMTPTQKLAFINS
jgi:hypothetical protein